MGFSPEAGFSPITQNRMGTRPQTCIGVVLSKEWGTNNANSINGLLKCKQARRSGESFRENMETNMENGMDGGEGQFMN